MTTLLHPHIIPPLTIERDDEDVPSHVAAGWLLVTDEEPELDPDQSGEDHDPERNPE